MSTIIHVLNNESDTPVGYVGTNSEKPTGWAAWGFAPKAQADFDWKIETTQSHQALLTKAGVYYIWDNGNWTILYQKAGSPDIMVLLEIQPGGQPTITLTVKADGTPKAIQTNHAQGAAS